MSAFTRIIPFISFFSLLSVLAFAQDVLKVEIAYKELNEFVNVRDFCISSDHDEIYFTIQSPFQEISQIAYMKKVDGNWSSPEIMPFSATFSDLEPFLSPDQTTLYFASNRPLSDSSNAEKDYDIWLVKRSDKNSPWSSPINMGKPVNSEGDEFYPSVSLNNNLYFTLDAPSGMGKDDIYFCQYQDGSYLQPQLLDSNINSDGYEFNAFISKNEDFLIYSKYNNEGGFGSGDLYISRKDSDGNWAKAVNLGAEINTKFMEYCPFYDEENEMLYFTSRRNSIAKTKFENITALKRYLLESESGLSKIYKVKIKIK